MDYTKMVADARDALFESLPEFDSDNEKARALVKDAYELAEEAHRPQKRKSGLPYILHPLAVAMIVVREMRQRDPSIVCAALLHDVVEDTDHTIEEISGRFGPDVAFLVDAVTKRNKHQVDNFQHILGSVQDDIRVLILKLSDRLHNMRTLDSMKPQKQWKIASETQFFFAPLAGRLGLYKVKSELENLAFKFLNPLEYSNLEQNLESDRTRTKNSADFFMEECKKIVSARFGYAVRWDIRYRKPYSIWREMQERSCDFYHVPFKHYIRAVFRAEDVEKVTGMKMEDQDIALKIYSMLASVYREQSGSLTNYMTQPKANGYKSVHFKLLNPYGNIDEFHISSEAMREQSYYGCILESKEQWLKRLTSVLKELSEDPETMMPGIHDSLYNEDVVVYTTQAKPVTLPKGASALDFAYGVHTDIGDHAKYARINGRLCSIRATLHRGDSVEIYTSDDIHPKDDWLKSVVTYKAKKHISSYLKKQVRQPYILCPHCHPLPESGELIGFEDGHGNITVHYRNCPDAIRTASERGHTIVAVEDFKADPGIVYPVRIKVTAIDRYHLLQDIIDRIVEGSHISMTGFNTRTEDEIVSSTIDFGIHSATELNSAISRISSIEGVEQVQVVKL